MQIDLRPDFSLLAVMAIFAVNYFVVRKFLFRPINDVLNARESEIKGSEAAFESAMEKFRAATSEMENRVYEAKKKGSEMRAAQRAEAAKFRAELVEKTRKQADEMVGKAEAQLTADRERARQELLSRADQLAREMAEKILGRKIA